jgi:hypothetical protein
MAELPLTMIGLPKLKEQDPNDKAETLQVACN